jgi:hypothetical protein
VQHFVEQTHSVNLPGFHGLLGVARQVALGIHFGREEACRRKVGEDDVAIRGEKRLIKFVAVARRSRNVKLTPGLV